MSYTSHHDPRSWFLGSLAPRNQNRYLRLPARSHGGPRLSFLNLKPLGLYKCQKPLKEVGLGNPKGTRWT